MKAFVLLLLLLCANSFAQIDNDFIERDQKLLLESFTGLERTMDYYNSDILAVAEKVKDGDYILSISESRAVDDFWERFIDLRIAFHTLYNTYKDVKEHDSRIDLIRYGSLVGLIYPAAIVVRKFWKNDRMRKILDGAANLEIPYGSYMSMQNEVFYQQRNLRESVKGEMEFLMLFPAYSLDDEVKKFEKSRDVLRLYRDNISTQLMTTADLYHLRYKKVRPFFNSLQTLMVLKFRNVSYKLKGIFYKNFLKISTWIGDTKIHRINSEYYNGDTLIKIPEAKKLQEKLQTGDILTSRSNWFLSNAFLPGFWPHSFIYLGNREEFINYFKDDLLTNNFFGKLCVEKKLKCNDFIGLLSNYEKTVKAWNDYPLKDDHGNEKVLIESTSEGVHFSSIRHTFLNDYLGALRPKISKLDLARSIYNSFMDFGKEYDFYLDWSTDDRIVCSELVSKSFRSDPSIGKNGVDFNYSIEQGMYIERVMGRIALPVVNIIQKAYDENVLNVRQAQMDFVAFLKGVRKTNSASFSTEREYYQSKDWPKWSFMQD